MKLREVLLRKRLGIPALLLLLVAAVLIAATAYVVSTAFIAYPTHQKLTLDLGITPAGYTVTSSVELFIGLPAAYKVTWTLTGQLQHYESITVTIKEGTYVFVKEAPDIVTTIATLTKATLTVTVAAPAGQGKIRYDFSVTPFLPLSPEIGIATAKTPAPLKITINVTKP